MPHLDLNEHAVRQHWQERHDNLLSRIIAVMEEAETWVHDRDPEVSLLLLRLAKKMSLLKTFQLDQEETWIHCLAHLGIARMLRMMQHIDQLKPGTASKLLIAAEVESKDTSTDAGLFLKRNLVFERMQLLGRIFSKERLRLVQRAVERIE